MFFRLANVVLLPLALVVLTAFNIGPMRTTAAGATLKYFIDQWQSQSLGETLSNTLIFATGSSAIALSGGVFFAFLSERTDMPYRSLVRIVIPLTVALPGTLYAIAWALLLDEQIAAYNAITKTSLRIAPFN